MSELNICVLDLETAHSADDCRHCLQPQDVHYVVGSVTKCFAGSTGPGYTKIGWDDKKALGLSIGCYYDYRDGRMHWFDAYTLKETIGAFVETQPLLVSFNGISFDFPLMRLCLPVSLDFPEQLTAHRVLSSNWLQLSARSYDILAEIWKVDPDRKFERGLNSLDAIANANGYGGKLSHGAEAPRRWARGEYAHVLNYCQDDVLKTKALFEQIVATGSIKRGDDMSIGLPPPCGFQGTL